MKAMFTRVLGFFKGYYSAMGKGNWARTILLIAVIGGLFWWQGLPLLQATAITKATEGMMATTDCKVADATTCKDVKGMMASADCKIADATTCKDVEGMMASADCKVADATTCGTFCPAAPACNEASAQTCGTFCPAAPAVAPAPAPAPVVAPAPSTFVVTFAGKADGTMDMACPTCPPGHGAQVTPSGVMITMPNNGGSYLCVRPPRVLGNGEMFQGNCAKQ